MDWKSEYAKSEGLTVTQSRILREGPKVCQKRGS